MDAYIFACEATQAAIDAVIAMVGNEVRVACPLIGARALYAAVSDSTASGLFTKVAAVSGTVGLVGVQTYLRTGSSSFAFPTYALVSDYVGFSLVTTTSVSTSYSAVQSITDVIGAATVIGSVPLLVESSAGTADDVQTSMNAVDVASGVVEAEHAVGATSLGAGWPT